MLRTWKNRLSGVVEMVEAEDGRGLASLMMVEALEGVDVGARVGMGCRSRSAIPKEGESVTLSYYYHNNNDNDISPFLRHICSTLLLLLQVRRATINRQSRSINKQSFFLLSLYHCTDQIIITCKLPAARKKERLTFSRSHALHIRNALTTLSLFLLAQACSSIFGSATGESLRFRLTPSLRNNDRDSYQQHLRLLLAFFQGRK